MNCRGMHPPKETFWTIPSWILTFWQQTLLGIFRALLLLCRLSAKSGTGTALELCWPRKLCFKCFVHILGMYCGLSTSMLFDGLFIHVCLLDAFFQLCLCFLLSCSYLVLLAATGFTVERYARAHVDVHLHKLLHIWSYVIYACRCTPKTTDPSVYIDYAHIRSR